jgi:hypothetical protein
MKSVPDLHVCGPQVYGSDKQWFEGVVLLRKISLTRGSRFPYKGVATPVQGGRDLLDSTSLES